MLCIFFNVTEKIICNVSRDTLTDGMYPMIWFDLPDVYFEAGNCGLVMGSVQSDYLNGQVDESITATSRIGHYTNHHYTP